MGASIGVAAKQPGTVMLPWPAGAIAHKHAYLALVCDMCSYTQVGYMQKLIQRIETEGHLL
jgi:hypothetical protein